jgi:hypothetical protein
LEDAFSAACFEAPKPAVAPHISASIKIGITIRNLIFFSFINEPQTAGCSSKSQKIFLCLTSTSVKLHQKKRIDIDGNPDVPASRDGVGALHQFVNHSVKCDDVGADDEQLPAVAIGDTRQRGFDGPH